MYSDYDPMKHATQKTLTNPEAAPVAGAFSVYYVDGVMNRDKDANMYPTSPSSSPGLKREGGVNAYRRTYPPTGPSRANHANQAIPRNYGGNTARICGNESTDALGGSHAFFSAKCRIKKV